MILFKSCPKCSTGDLLKTQDMFGEYFECVQCGFVRDLGSTAPMRAPVAQADAGAGVDPPLLSA